MTEQLWWYVARSTGIVAWALVATSVIWGLAFSARLAGRRPGPRWVLDLHRFLGGLAVIFTAVHLAGLALDSYTTFGPADLLIPLASAWKPLPVALGVVAMYLLAAVELTSLAMSRLPRRWWRRIHYLGFGLFWLTTAHAVTAGTDTRHPLLSAAYILAAGAVAFLTSLRALADRRRPQPRTRPGSSPSEGGGSRAGGHRELLERRADVEPAVIDATAGR
jgi:DMSO/TMAO reductase YedYZ heme-binding membrane subunit